MNSPIIVIVVPVILILIVIFLPGQILVDLLDYSVEGLDVQHIRWFILLIGILQLDVLLTDLSTTILAVFEYVILHILDRISEDPLIEGIVVTSLIIMKILVSLIVVEYDRVIVAVDDFAVLPIDPLDRYSTGRILGKGITGSLDSIVGRIPEDLFDDLRLVCKTNFRRKYDIKIEIETLVATDLPDDKTSLTAADQFGIEQKFLAIGVHVTVCLLVDSVEFDLDRTAFFPTYVLESVLHDITPVNHTLAAFLIYRTSRRSNPLFGALSFTLHLSLGPYCVLRLTSSLLFDGFTKRSTAST